METLEDFLKEKGYLISDFEFNGIVPFRWMVELVDIYEQKNK